ncbi:AAA family ATPase [Anaerorhabdus sp.]|uniref:AAA family ATPase n=1 Tax=Anaerorhabdus sp. TaxID=1872524 RepID=UPI002FC7F53D
MLCSINNIDIPIPYSNKRATIILDGKSLIITGNNGSGKTSFIKDIYSHLSNILKNRSENDLNHLKNQKLHYEELLKRTSKDNSSYKAYAQRVNEYNTKIKHLSDININTSENDVTDTRSLLRFHAATRQSAIASPTQAPKHSILVEQNKDFDNEKDGSNFFESYLLSLKKNQSYAIAFDEDLDEANRINAWFNKIQNDLRLLFEDSSLELIFNSKDEKFYLIQKNKEPYTFQALSSGYSSILSIYTDLIMRVEMWNVTPENIEGIIFIDEIDAHLHVSLQKQILRFFINSFPKVQFIVTTHSPFVVTSVTNTIIYDLTSNEQIIDISSYSYGIVMEELFGVKTESHALLDKLNSIETLLKEITPNNIKELDDEISSLAAAQGNMSEEVQAFLDHAKLEILKMKKQIQG